VRRGARPQRPGQLDAGGVGQRGAPVCGARAARGRARDGAAARAQVQQRICARQARRVLARPVGLGAVPRTAGGRRNRRGLAGRCEIDLVGRRPAQAARLGVVRARSVLLNRKIAQVMDLRRLRRVWLGCQNPQDRCRWWTCGPQCRILLQCHHAYILRPHVSIDMSLLRYPRSPTESHLRHLLVRRDGCVGRLRSPERKQGATRKS